jgi:hypothetical protein
MGRLHSCRILEKRVLPSKHRLDLGRETRNDSTCWLSVGRGGAADCAVKRKLAALAAFDGVRNRSDNPARHENDEKDEKDSVDCVGRPDKVCAERNSQALVQGDSQ